MKYCRKTTAKEKFFTPNSAFSVFSRVPRLKMKMSIGCDNCIF